MAITMKQIAAQLGVSRTSVSAVLNEKTLPRVSDETRMRILELARKAKYRPNISAQFLCGKPGKNIAIIRSGYTWILYNDVIDIITAQMAKRGYYVFYTDILEAGQEAAVMAELASRGTDGFVVFHNSGALNHADYQHPLVQISDCTGNFDLSVDLDAGGYLVTSHLLQHGHRHIGFLCDHLKGANRYKYNGYCRAYNEAGIEITRSIIIELEKELNSLPKLEKLCMERQVSGWICSNDELAGRLMAFLSRHGFRIPDDFVVTGFDGVNFTEFTVPSITTVVQPLATLAEETVRILQEKLDSMTLSRIAVPVILNPHLRIGGSCGCQPRNVQEFTYNHTNVSLKIDNI